MSKQIIVYPISANPPTWGHADLVKRAAAQFDQVYWAVGINPAKKVQLPIDLRLAMMQDYIDHYQLKNVVPDHFQGSTVRYAQSKGANLILRGLRGPNDFQGELELATGNSGIDETIETVCMFAKPELVAVSSTIIRQLATLDENIDHYVLPKVAEKIKAAFS